MESQVDIILLAGGKCSKELREKAGVSAKGLIPLAGKPLYRYVLDAVLEMPVEKRVILYSGGDETLSKDARATGVEVLDEPDTMVGALAAAGKIFGERAEETSQKQDIFIVSSDIPFVTAEILMDVLTKARELQADAVWPITEKSFVEAKFPGSKRTYVKTVQGTFTGGNVFLLKLWVLLEKLQLIDRLFKARKNPLAMAFLMGLGVVFQVARGRVSIPAMERAVSKRVSVKIRALRSPYAEISVDLDKLSDLITMENFLQRVGALTPHTKNTSQP